MSVNSSSASNSSLDSELFHCDQYTVSISISTAFNATRVALLLPLSILVLYLGRHRSSATKSDSDIVVYHMAATELIWCFSCVSFYCGFFTDLPEMMTIGNWLQVMSYPGQGFFHVLTCVERYLAVVHPVTYLGLRKGPGIRIRNISIGCVWLLCFGWIVVTALLFPSSMNVSLLIMLPVNLLIVTFCSFSVLRVLIRPGSGEVGGNKGKVDQSKQSALHTVMAITGVLWFWLIGVLVSVTLKSLLPLSPKVLCGIETSMICFNLPSSLVLPLMFLHRGGELSCCSHKSG